MKKISILLFVLLFSIVCITGCGETKPSETVKKPVTITDNEGNTTDYTWDELQKYLQENRKKLSGLLVGAKITFTDTINYVDTTPEYRMGNTFCKTIGTVYHDKVLKYDFKTDWITLYLYQDLDNVQINDYKRGETITVTTNISTVDREGDKFYLHFTSYDGDVCRFGSTPTTITKVEQNTN